MSRITELENLIRKYATSYYTGNAEVSDEIFDSLVDELRSLNPNSEVLTTGWGFTPDKSRKKMNHLYGLEVGSLNKIKSIEGKNYRNKRVSAKLDGISAVSYYKYGERFLCLTREGTDITDKINIIDMPGCIIDDTFSGAIRGEVVMSNRQWDRLLEEVGEDDVPANSRNFVAGVMNRNDLDINDLLRLDYVVYKVIKSENHEFKDLNEVSTFLCENFDKVVNYRFFDEVTQDCLDREFKTCKLLYPCDGLVISDNTLDDECNPESEVAFKFKAESKVVTVEDVTYNVTRTGRLAPIVWFDPVKLSGAVVQKCTGFNAQFIKDYKIGKGSVIEVCRSNEVIPYIVNVIEGVDPSLPKTCPNCGSVLTWKGVDLVCSEESESQLPYHYITTIAPEDGAGYSLYSEIVKVSELENLYDLCKFLLNLDDYRDRCLSNINGYVTKKLINKIFDKLGSPVDPVRFLVACNIRGLGWGTSEKLIDEYPTIIDDIKFGSLKDDKIVKIKGLGYSTLNSVKGGFDRINELSRVVTFNKVSKAVNSELFKVAITGSLSVKRSDFEKLLNDKGIKQSSNLKECKYLITNNPDSGSSKMKNAKKYNVEIVSEKEFYDKYLV